MRLLISMTFMIITKTWESKSIIITRANRGYKINNFHSEYQLGSWRSLMREINLCLKIPANRDIIKISETLMEKWGP